MIDLLENVFFEFAFFICLCKVCDVLHGTLLEEILVDDLFFHHLLQLLMSNAVWVMFVPEFLDLGVHCAFDYTISSKNCPLTKKRKGEWEYTSIRKN